MQFTITSFKKHPLLLLLVAIPALCSVIHSSKAASSEVDPEWRRFAEEILSKYPLIDGHNDLPELFRGRYSNVINNLDLAGPLPGQTDLPRMKKGMMGGQFWSIYVPCKKNDLEYYDQVRMTLEQIDVTRRFINHLPNDLEFADSTDAVMRIFRSGKVASMMGVEGGHMIDLSLAVLRAYFHLGVRYMTLTHGCNVKWADSATDVVVNDGLSQFGVAVVAEMNRLGMLVDLAHVSANVMKDAIDNSVAPVIFSHSSAFAICNHPRNVPDDVLRMLSKKGGVVMVNFYSGYVKCGGDDSLGNAKLSDVADHIEHIAKVAGWEHVGIGGDYDGVDRLPDGLEDVSKYPDLVAELARRGATEDQLAGLVGMNLIRVWQQAEKVAEELKSERPHEDLYEINKVCPVQSSLKFLNQDQHLKQN